MTLSGAESSVTNRRCKAFVPQSPRAGAEAGVDFGGGAVRLAGQAAGCYLFGFRRRIRTRSRTGSSPPGGRKRSSRAMSTPSVS